MSMYEKIVACQQRKDGHDASQDTGLNPLMEVQMLFSTGDSALTRQAHEFETAAETDLGHLLVYGIIFAATCVKREAGNRWEEGF